MKVKISIFFFFLFSSYTSYSQCAACRTCDSTITGTNTRDYNLSGFDDYCIAAGAVVNGNITISGGAYLCNNGTINGSVTASGTDDVFNKGTINGGDVHLSNTANLCNDGTIDADSVIAEGTSDVFNYGIIDLTGNFTLTSSGGVTNGCGLFVGGHLNIQSQSDLYGSITVGGNFYMTTDVTLHGQLVVDDTLIFLNAVVDIGMTDDAYLEVDYMSDDVDGDINGPTGGSELAYLKINGDAIGSDPTDVNNNIDLCGSCTNCDIDGAVNDNTSCPITKPAVDESNCAAGHTLPIVLMEFKSSCSSGGVVLNWITASEINNNYFTIERSLDGINWEVVTIVMGAGNSNQPLHYTATDNDGFRGMSYYRLKQTDFDGKMEYFSPQAINCLTPESGRISIYPNPTNNYFGFVAAENVDVLSMEVRDVRGREVLSKTYNHVEGDVAIKVDVSNLSPAVYTVSFTTSTDFVHQKLIIK